MIETALLSPVNQYVPESSHQDRVIYRRKDGVHMIDPIPLIDRIAQDARDHKREVQEYTRAMREQVKDSEARFTTLANEIKSEVKELRAEVQEIKVEVAEVKDELKTEIAEVKTELRAEIAEVKTELKAEIAEVRTVLQTTETGLKSEIGKVKDVLEAKIAKVQEDTTDKWAQSMRHMQIVTISTMGFTLSVFLTIIAFIFIRVI